MYIMYYPPPWSWSDNRRFMTRYLYRGYRGEESPGSTGQGAR